MDDLVRKIRELKKKRDAVILAHNYQRPEVQDIADFVGDSLELSREATKIDAKVIVFCGVFFMAETAKLLSPDKIVLIPDLGAKCAMAEMIDVEGLRELKAKHPKAKVVCYVNSTADIKAECDACCTSSNAVSVVAGIDAGEIIFVPDKYLAAYVEKELKARGVRKGTAEKRVLLRQLRRPLFAVPNSTAQSGAPRFLALHRFSAVPKKIIPWNGFCPTHVKIIPNYLRDLKKKYPSAVIITHPECTPDANRESDAVLSTSGMVKFVKETDADTVIVGTETGIIHKFKKEAPGKTFIPATELAVCPNMKMITLEKVYESLRDMKYEVKVDTKIAKKALKAIDEMMKYV